MQGLFETANLPYAGMRTLASAVFMDKVATKRLLRGLDIPMLPYAVVSRAAGGLPSAETLSALLSPIGFPCIVKPAHLGSSIGVGKADDVGRGAGAVADDLPARPAGPDRAVHPEPRRIQFVGDAGRRRGADLGDRAAETRRGAARFPPEIHVGRRRQRAARRRRGGSQGMLSLTRDINPSMPDGMEADLRRWAIAAFEAVAGTGAPRIDFYCNAATGEAWLNEVNPIPGSFALFPVGGGRSADRVYRTAVAPDRRGHRAAPRNAAARRPGAAGSAAVAPALAAGRQRVGQQHDKVAHDDSQSLTAVGSPPAGTR